MNAVSADQPGKRAVAFIVATDRAPDTFRIDDDAFERWMVGKDDTDLDDPDAEPDWLPDWIEYGAATALAQLFADAWTNAVVTGDPDVKLNVYADDDQETDGFYVILNNHVGAQTSLGITSGWQELLHLEDMPPRERARAYLEEICVIANSTLAQLHVYSDAMP